MKSKPLCIDLFCGLGGWTDGFLAEGYDVVGFDIERHDYGTGGYPAQLVLQDVRTISGVQFKDADVIVASPPCQKYSYMAMPWTRAKKLAIWYREDAVRIVQLNELFNSCFRIQQEANQAAGHSIPLVVENVKGAQPWVNSARWRFGSYYLWGDVPALMPITTLKAAMKVGDVGWRRDGKGTANHSFQGAAAEAIKNNGGSWFNQAHNTESGLRQNPVNLTKVEGISFSGYGKPGYKAQGFNVTAAQRYREEQGIKQEGSGPEWFDKGIAKHSSRSDSRKAARAQIAKIPFELARHIARVFKPESTDL